MEKDVLISRLEKITLEVGTLLEELDEDSHVTKFLEFVMNAFDTKIFLINEVE